ncbi:DUF4124 domain-containing protein [Psychrobacter sp. Cmf 22.2]|nr:DUF4124 domain-containing protein [Psychrobacter sp. Cmf 22.2]
MTLVTKRIFSKKSSSKTSLRIGMLCGMAMITAILPISIANATPIYKVVDEQTGHVTFTDRPQSYEQQTDKQVSQTDVVTNVTANNNANNRSDTNFKGTSATSSQAVAPLVLQQAASNSTKFSQINYQLTMLEPSEARAYRRPAQSIDVKLELRPALQDGDSVGIYLDGNEVAQGLSVSIATVDILPGTHSIQAIIKNKAGRTLSQIERTVYVIQNTVILQNKKKVAMQMLAYERLPWRKKMLLKLRQKDSYLQKVESSQPVTNDAFTKR